MPMIKRLTLCQDICRKIGIVRKDPGKDTFDKRELLHVNSAMDLLPKTAKRGITKNDKAKNK